jgi:hypothetical protein
MISDHNWTLTSSSLRNRAISFFLDKDRTIPFPGGQKPRTETGLELQKSQTISMGFAFEFAGMDDLSNDQYRGPPAGSPQCSQDS